MKNLYINLVTLLISIFGFYSCTSDSIIEDSDTSTPVPALFYLDNQTKQPDKKQVSSKATSSHSSNESIIITSEEEEWEPKRIFQTKTSWTNSSNTVNWSSGDQIGIFMQQTSGVAIPGVDRNNVQYNIQTANSSSSTLTANSSPIYFPSQTNPMMRFFAYYPYTASNNSLLINYSLPENQSTPQQLSAADLMNATSSATNGSNPNIALAFNHQMVLLSFKINTSLFLLSGTLTKVTISGTNITNTGTLDLTTSTLTPNTSSTFSPYVITNQFINSSSSSAYVDIIINPCTINNNSSSNQLKVTLDFKGLLSHSTNLDITSGSSSKTFVGGTRYIYNLSVLLSL